MLRSRTSREVVPLRPVKASGVAGEAILVDLGDGDDRSRRMTSIWAQSVAGALDDALITLALAVGVCEDDVWDTSMWVVPDDDPARPLNGPGGSPVTDPAERLALAQRFSTPWSVSWHTLEVLDYDLTGDLSPWAGPPEPFADHPHWRDFTSLPRPWRRSEILGYIEHCRGRVRDTFDGLTDDRAATSLPTYRRPGTPYARVLVDLIAHTNEHAAQILQHLNAATRPE